jgi:hypothetical protein
MEVEMPDALPALRARINHRPITILSDAVLIGDFGGEAEQVAEQSLVAGGGIVE